MVARVLERTGSLVWARGAMYKAVAQLVLLYGIESWVVTGEILKVLEGLYHQVAQRITGMRVKHRTGGKWEYPSVVEAMEAAGIHTICVYMKRW